MKKKMNVAIRPRFVPVMKPKIRDFSKFEKLYVWPMFDVQYGSKSCLEKKFLRYVEWAKNTPNVVIILGGDLMENAIPEHIPSASFEQIKQPHTQFQELRDLLMPLKEKILVGTTGNHELRTWKKTGFDPTEWLCYSLNVPYVKFGGYLQIAAGDEKYLMAFHHGASA